jgi:folate-binding protein YgfZ
MATLREQVEAIRANGAVLVRPDVRTLKLSGPDAERFLNGMISIDAAKLSPGRGAMAVKTTNKGRVEGLLRARRTEDAFLLDLLEASAERVRSSLERFIIMDDCAVSDVSSEREVVSLFGARPAAANFFPNASQLMALDVHAFVRDPEGRTIIRDGMLGLEGFEIHLAKGLAEKLISELADHRGALRIDPSALETARIEAGFPRDGVDIDEDTIPMEARLELALDFHKGCYIGQEVIARATNLGGIKHVLVGLVVEAANIPTAGTLIYCQDPKDRIGEVTSAVFSPTFDRPIALGYVKKAHDAPGTRLWLETGPGSAPSPAIVTALPFVR